MTATATIATVVLAKVLSQRSSPSLTRAYGSVLRTLELTMVATGGLLSHSRARAGSLAGQGHRWALARRSVARLTRIAWPRTAICRPEWPSDLDELDAEQVAEDLPAGGVAAEVEHLMVRPAVAQPAVEAFAYPAVRAELPIGHLERGQFLTVQHLALGHHHAKQLALQRDQGGQGRRARLVLEEEGRRVVEAADAKWPLDELHRAVTASHLPVPFPHVAHEDGVGREVHGVHLGEVRVADEDVPGVDHRRGAHVAFGGVAVSLGHEAGGGGQRQPGEPPVLADRVEMGGVRAVPARSQDLLDAHLHPHVVHALLDGQPRVDLEVGVLEGQHLGHLVLVGLFRGPQKTPPSGPPPPAPAAAARPQRAPSSLNEGARQSSVTTWKGTPARTMAFAVSCAPCTPWLYVMSAMSQAGVTEGSGWMLARHSGSRASASSLATRMAGPYVSITTSRPSRPRFSKSRMTCSASVLFLIGRPGTNSPTSARCSANSAA